MFFYKTVTLLKDSMESVLTVCVLMHKTPKSSPLTGILVVKMSTQETLYFTEVLLNSLFVILFCFDLSERVNHSGMILMTEGLTNLFKREIRVFSGQIHGQVSGIRIDAVLSFGEEIAHGNIEIPGRGRHNVFKVDLGSVLVSHQSLDHGNTHRAVVEGRERLHSNHVFQKVFDVAARIG